MTPMIPTISRESWESNGFPGYLLTPMIPTISRANAKPSPGITWGSIAIVSSNLLVRSRVRTTTHDTMKLKNKTRSEAPTTKTIVFLITSIPPMIRKISLYQRKLTSDNASAEGIRKYGRNDAHNKTSKGKNTGVISINSKAI